MYLAWEIGKGDMWCRVGGDQQRDQTRREKVKQLVQDFLPLSGIMLVLKLLNENISPRWASSAVSHKKKELKHHRHCPCLSLGLNSLEPRELRSSKVRQESCSQNVTDSLSSHLS